MQIVIEMPERIYLAIVKSSPTWDTEIDKFIRKGIALPEHIRISKEKDNICLDVKYDDLEEG